MTKCILIDDDQGILEVFSDLLETIGIEILGTGSDGKEAVDLYKKYKPDIVFTDLSMPKFDGLYGIETIKDDFPDAKIIVITANSDAYNLPIFDILHIPIITKPFKVHTIKQAISDALLTGDDTQEVFEIQYEFKEDTKAYSCFVTFEQYRNVKKLDIIDKVTILDIDKQAKPNEEIQDALDAASKNDPSKLQNISKENKSK